MQTLSSLLLAAGLTASAFAAEVSSDMGPAAFLWPPDRVWSAALDNTPPCGSQAAAGNRTQFPLTGGWVSLVDQQEGFDLQLSVSYSQDPASNSDFSVLIASDKVKELDRGHTCIGVPNAPGNIKAGSNATLQIVYLSKGDSANANETFYACADITYVDAASFTTDSHCFNATEPDGPSPTNMPGSTTSAPSTSEGSGSSGGISGGAIAGAVVGSIVGFVLLGGLGFWLYRRGQQKMRLAMMEANARNAKWDDPRNTPGSQNSVPLRDL